MLLDQPSFITSTTWVLVLETSWNFRHLIHFAIWYTFWLFEQYMCFCGWKCFFIDIERHYWQIWWNKLFFFQVFPSPGCFFVRQNLKIKGHFRRVDLMYSCKCKTMLSTEINIHIILYILYLPEIMVKKNVYMFKLLNKLNKHVKRHLIVLIVEMIM